MAEAIKRENVLLAITVRLRSRLAPGRADHGVADLPSAVLTVSHGEERLGELTIPVHELGVRGTGELWPGDVEPDSHIPSAIAQQLTDLVATVSPDSPLLWLHLATPSGFLPLLPWERMLGEIFSNRPVMRVPNFAFLPAADVEYYDVAICAGARNEDSVLLVARQVAQLASRLGEDLFPLVRVHVFAEANLFSHLVGFDTLGYELHRPPSGRATGGERYGTSAVDGWRTWIGDAISHASLDAVHFVADVLAAGDEPSIVLATDPAVRSDDPALDFLGISSIASLVGGVSAWAVGISAPMDEAISPMAARLMAERLAHQRAGPILLHEFSSDPEAKALSAMYGSIFGHRSPIEPSAVAAYCHPRVFEPVGPKMDSLSPALRQIVSSAAWFGSPTDAPWVVATQRALEQSVAALFPEPDQREVPVTANAVAQGAQDALKLFREIVGKYETSPGDGPEGGGSERAPEHEEMAS